MSNRNRLCLGVAATALVCALSAAALARTSGYTISSITVPKSVKERPLDKPQGKPFAVTVKGSAKNESALGVYLDYRKCAASASKEAERDSLYRAGYSFFIGPSSVTGTDVKGPFKKSFSAHPGGKTGGRYVCAYLTTGKTVTRTRAIKSATYRVTK